jgi:hypothetical protein
MNIHNIEESPAYQAWLYSQYEPDDNLFIGKPPAPKDLPGWMTRGPYHVPEDDWQEKERRGDEFLKLKGIE